jgi:hypothetical protein
VRKQVKRILSTAIACFVLITCVLGVYALPGGSSGAGRIDNHDKQGSTTSQSTVVLSSSTPGAGGVIASVDDSISLVFTGAITYTASSRSRSITLLKDSRINVPVTVTASGSTGLIVKPVSALEKGSSYKLYVYGVKDSEGLAVKQFTISFTTPAASGMSAIQLKSSTPAEGSTLATTGASVVLLYTGNINYSSTSSVQFLKNASTTVPVTVTAAASTLVVTPTVQLSTDAYYILYVKGLTDGSGNKIADLSLTFNKSVSDDEDEDSDTDKDNTSNTKKDNGKGKAFSDINAGHWAYDAIMELTALGILSGFGDNTFRPNADVSRVEFASMFVKALDLKNTGSTQTFSDVPKTNWAYDIVEAAKAYLTGFRSSDGKLYFYGSRDAVREDMAVALVKALGLTVQSNNTKLQEIYDDYEDISPALRDYVYTAYVEGIMKGTGKKFSPQDTLTRAQAAILIKRALIISEKVVIGDDSTTEDKVVVGGDTVSTNASLSALYYNGAVISGFASGTYNYTVQLPHGTTAVPTVTAGSADTGATITITNAATLPGAAIITVKAADGKTILVYTITFTVAAQ